jgi:sulfate transport system ATP-binding protein
MHQGRVEQIGTPDEVYNDPATAFVAGFVGAANVLRGEVHDGRLRFGRLEVLEARDLEEGKTAQVFIRPHDVRVLAAGTAANGSSVPAVLDRVNNLGWMSKLHLRLDDGQTLVAQVPNEELPDFPNGAHLFVDLQNAKVFPEVEHIDEGEDGLDSFSPADTTG